MRIGIKENAWWNFMRNGLQGEHHWVYHLGKFFIPKPKKRPKNKSKTFTNLGFPRPDPKLLFDIAMLVRMFWVHYTIFVANINLTLNPFPIWCNPNSLKMSSLVPPLKSYIPNKEYLQSIDQFLDLFDNEAMNFYDLSLSQSYVSNVTALAPINMLTAPMDFWYGSKNIFLLQGA